MTGIISRSTPIWRDRVLLYLSLCSILFFMNYHVSHANSLVGLPSSTAQQTEVDASQISRDEINQVARGLWCPLCSGVRLDSCELQACEQMRQEIGLKLAEGATEDEITEYFLAQYGPQVLGEPPNQGFNRLAWIVPIVALIAGAAYLVMMRRNQAKMADLLAEDIAEFPTSQRRSTDSYDEMLDDELKKYD